MPPKARRCRNCGKPYQPTQRSHGKGNGMIYCSQTCCGQALHQHERNVELMQRYDAGERQKDLAVEFGICSQRVSTIIKETRARLADPEPKRATDDIVRSSRESPKAAVPATVSAAKAEAEEAIPAPVGKSLRETMRAHCLDPASARIRSRCRDARSVAIGPARVPFRVKMSWVSAGAGSTVVVVLRQSRLSEIEGLAGKRRSGSVCPQYLTKAMLA